MEGKSNSAEVFISTEELQALLDAKTENLKVFNVTYNSTEMDMDPIVQHHMCYIPSYLPILLKRI